MDKAEMEKVARKFGAEMVAKARATGNALEAADIEAVIGASPPTATQIANAMLAIARLVGPLEVFPEMPLPERLHIVEKCVTAAMVAGSVAMFEASKSPKAVC